MSRRIEYQQEVQWIGNTGHGTSNYQAYSRDYEVAVEGKPTLAGSAGHNFLGNPERNDPEDHFLAAIAGCHLLSYLALAARHGVVVTGYIDRATGVLELEGGGGRFSEVVLSPTVTISAGSDPELARSLHDEAHRQCFIANSCSVPIHHRPTIVGE